MEQITKSEVTDLVGVGDGRSQAHPGAVKDVKEGRDLQEDAVRSLKTENETAESGSLEEEINPWQFLSLGPPVDKPEDCDMVADYDGSDDDLNNEVMTETAVEGGEEAMLETAAAAVAEESTAAMREAQLLNLARGGTF